MSAGPTDDSLLLVTPRIPYPPDRGDKLKMFHVIKNLAEDRSITVLTFGRPQDVPAELTQYCTVEVVPHRYRDRVFGALRAALQGKPLQVGYYSSPAMKRLVERELSSQRHATMHLHLIRLAHLRSARLPVLLDITDCTSLYLERRAMLAGNLVARRFWRWEGRTMARYEQVLADCALVSVCSPLDRQVLADRVPDASIEVFENGIDLEYFQRRSPRANTGEILFTGNMSYAPNSDAAVFLACSVFPLVRAAHPGSRLVLAGQSPSKKVTQLGKLPGVEVTGYVDDLRALYERAEIAVAPVRFGSGTLNKVLEPMAMEIPVVATAVAVGGMTARARETVVTADDTAEGFAAAVNELLRDPQRQENLACAARKVVEQANDWRNITRRLSEAHQRLATGHKAAS